MSKIRIERGAQAQVNFASILENYDIPIVSIAIRASKLPDIVFRMNNKLQQAEVKSTSDFTSITVFDKTITRGKKNPDVDIIIKQLKGYDSFEQYVDHLRQVKGDRHVGFVGDNGIEVPSGRVPKEDFEFKTPTDKNLFIQLIRAHWADSGDDYFAIVQTGGVKFSLFSTNMRTKKIMGMNAIPFDSTHIREAFLDTSGGFKDGTGKGKLRVALKVVLNTGTVKTKITSKFLK
jgi:hypothetical protein